jgi:hypothetical protein
MRDTVAPDGRKLTCRNKRQWPPRSAWEDLSFVELAAVLPEAEFTRHQSWLKHCGILKMQPEKCLNCPHVGIDGKFVTEPGIGRPAPPFMQKRP